MMIERSDHERRRTGRVPGPRTIKTSVMLPPELVEWAKYQPGGMSALIRVLLEMERTRRDA